MTGGTLSGRKAMPGGQVTHFVERFLSIRPIVTQRFQGIFYRLDKSDELQLRSPPITQ